MSAQPTNRRIVSRFFGNIPLRIILVLPFIILITGAVGLTGYLSFQSRQAAIDDVATQLRDEITRRVEDYLFNMLDLPHQLNQINKNAIEDGVLRLDDYDGVQKYFWRQIETFDTVSYVQVGTEQREFIAAERQESRLRMPNKAINGYCAYYSDGQGNRTEVAKCTENYDPRARPWYTLAVEAGQPVWTEIYQYNNAELGVRLGTSAVLPVYDKQGDLLGVVGADITLHGLGDFLRSLDAGKTGQAFIMERDGLLVASSTIDQPFKINADESERIFAVEAEDLLVSATARMLTDHYGKLDAIQATRQLEFDLEGMQQFVQVLPISDGRGIEWLFVVVIPASDFLTQISDNNQTTFLLIILALIAAATIGIITARWITRPILELSASAEALAKGQWDQTVTLQRTDELGKLANAFNHMAEQLQESFATLEINEEKYRTLFEDSNDAIFITAPSGQIIDMNSAGLSLFGYSKDKITKLKVRELYVNPVDRINFRDLIERQGMVRDFEVSYRKKDGTIIDCLETATVRRAEDGAPISYQGIIRDITEHKRVEQERLQFSALQRELTIAREIQDSLLPSTKPDWPDLDAICYSKPALEVGGDFYAYHALKPQDERELIEPMRYMIAVGDVSGKGIPAALLMAVSLASFQSIIVRDFTPSQLMAYLNRVIRLYTEATSQNCAFVYAEICGITENESSAPSDANPIYRLRTANAGCIFPLLRRSNGDVEWVEAFGLPLGVTAYAETNYQEKTVDLYKGDMVILTSDGVVEAQNAAGELWGFDHLEQAVASGPTNTAEAMLNHLNAAIDAFLDTDPHDDLTMVIIRI